MRKRILLATGAACALVLGGTAVPASARQHDDLSTVTGGLDGPRGVAVVRPGATLVSETDGTVDLVRRHRHHAATVEELTSVPTLLAPAIAYGGHGLVYILTGAATDPDASSPPPPPDVAAAEKKLFAWRPGWDAPRLLADIGAYQSTDPDPYDQEDNPTDSNPYGVAVLDHGSVLVADAAGNDLLKVSRYGHIRTVAELKPRVVPAPEGSGPPAGTPITAEAVATSVTVGSDGAYYVGELRGFPATPGTSEIWRISPRRHGTAVCDPAAPYAGPCTRYADGLTSIVDLAPGRHGSIYAVSLSKLSWLAVESPTPVPGAEIGGLYQISRGGRHVTELATDQLTLPGGVDTGRDGVFVTGPVFGPGALYRIHR